MKQSFVSLMLLLSASFILPSCEKVVFDYSPQMEAYYVESKGLFYAVLVIAIVIIMILLATK